MEKKEMLKNEEHIKALLELIGEDTSREGLLDTPKRVLKSYQDLFKGYNQDIKFTVFENESNVDQIVGLSEVEFQSTCEHHMLPFFGTASIYYIPKDKIVGISKLARVLDLFAKRLQNQERLAKQVADYLQEHLKPEGIAVVLKAKHFCMVSRGVVKQNSVMVTSDLRGAFKDDLNARTELFNLIN